MESPLPGEPAAPEASDQDEARAARRARSYARWRDAIIGRMIVENARDLSDAEIERTLAQCVGGTRMIEIAKAMRDCASLTFETLEAERAAYEQMIATRKA